MNVFHMEGGEGKGLSPTPAHKGPEVHVLPPWERGFELERCHGVENPFQPGFPPEANFPLIGELCVRKRKRVFVVALSSSS